MIEQAMLVPLLAAAVQSGTPILYATLGELLSEKGGVLNLGVEGMMVVGALTAFVVSFSTGSPWLGVAAGGAAGAVLAGLHCVVCLVFLGNQVVSGLALTILGLGLSGFWGTPFIGLRAPGFDPLPLGFLSDLPVVGPVFFSQDILVYISFALPFALWVFLHRTRFGVILQAAGENPEAAKAAGIGVRSVRAFAAIAGGFLSGLGGAYLSLAYTHLWTNGLTAGRGWIAVALVIFAFWRPMRAMAGAYLFGGVTAFQLRLQASGTTIPSSVLLMLPYVLTIVVLAVSTLRSKGGLGPAALGTTIEPEE